MDTLGRFIEILFPLLKSVPSLELLIESQDHLTAYHEAGHFFMACKEGLKIDYVTIRPTNDLGTVDGVYLGKTGVKAPSKMGNVGGYTKFVFAGCISQYYQFRCVWKNHLKGDINILFDEEYDYYSDNDFKLLIEIFEETAEELINEKAIKEIESIARYLLKWKDCGGNEIKELCPG